MANEIINAHAYLFPRLPAEYQEVEWIAAAEANAHIDISWTPPYGTGFRVKALRTGQGYSTGGHIVSSQTTNAGGWLVWRPTPAAYAYYYGQGSQAFNFIESGSPQIIEVINRQIAVDSVVLGEVAEPETIVTAPMRLLNYATYTAARDYGFYGNLYFVECWNDEAIVKKFIPCFRKSDNKIGVYEIIDKAFYAAYRRFNKGPNIN